MIRAGYMVDEQFPAMRAEFIDLSDLLAAMRAFQRISPDSLHSVHGTTTNVTGGGAAGLTASK
jgi:hypothetical protein